MTSQEIATEYARQVKQDAIRKSPQAGDRRGRTICDSEYLSTDENDFLQHWSRWGSDMYPVSKTSGGRWVWTEFCGIKGAPTVYKTKRAACEAVELYVHALIDRSAGRLGG
jgi:hypothetical protein